MLKQGLKTINAEFIRTSALSHALTFFGPFKTSCNLIPRASSLFVIDVKR